MSYMSNYPKHSEYLASCRKAFEITASGGTVKLFWDSSPLDAAGWKREFLRALHRRINAKEGPYDIWRKQMPDYQLCMARDRARLREIRRRVRVYEFETPEMRKRFGHLLSGYDWEIL